MKNKLFTIFLSFCFMFSFCAWVSADEAEEDTKSVSVADALDITNEKKDVEEIGIPTPSLVKELETDANELFEAKKYKEAAEAYAELASKSNYLANLISQGLEPFYNKRYSDDDYDSSYVFALAKYERQSNDYKSLRNTAFVKQALCYYYLEDYISALPLLDKALDLIDVKDTDNWTLAREALYDIIDVE